MFLLGQLLHRTPQIKWQECCTQQTEAGWDVLFPQFGRAERQGPAVLRQQRGLETAEDLISGDSVVTL